MMFSISETPDHVVYQAGWRHAARHSMLTGDTAAGAGGVRVSSSTREVSNRELSKALAFGSASI